MIFCRKFSTFYGIRGIAYFHFGIFCLFTKNVVFIYFFQFTVRDTASQPASTDVRVNFALIKCLYLGCVPPQAVAPGEQERPSDIPLYSDPNSWGAAEDGVAAGWWNSAGVLGSGVPDNTAVKVEIYESK